MCKIARIFLGLAIASLIAGLTPFGSSLGYGILKPLGAVFFIVFFIVNVFAREMAEFDEEQRQHCAAKKPTKQSSHSLPTGKAHATASEPV